MRMLPLVIVASSVLIACQQSAPTGPIRSGPYLGEPPPGTAPALFADGLVSTHLDERDAAWTPDGNELYYTLWAGNRGTIVTVRSSDGAWAPPAIASFSGRHSDLEPFITAAGDALYFASQRPLDPGGAEQDWDLWVAHRTADGWAEPTNLGTVVNSSSGEYYPSLTRDGTLYFTAIRADSLGAEDIYRSRLVDGSFETPENLGPAVNSPGPEYNSLVAPDESWLIFGSARAGDLGGGDLYIAFRKGDGSWAPAINMGEPFNSPALDFCPALSLDGRYLFFTSRRAPEPGPRPTTYQELVAAQSQTLNGSMNLYWVEAAAIETLRHE